MKKALIIGCTGQDGTYLFENLQKRNYEIIGIARDVVRSTSPKSIKLIDISKSKQVYDLLDVYKPDEIYYLAAFHQSSEDQYYDDAELFRRSFDVNVLSLINFLEGIKKYSKYSRLFYAASSHIFGNPAESIQDETTPFNPNSIYGITKTAGVLACRLYRENHSIFASVGILYNHESPLRPSKFVSQKIVKTAVAIKYKNKNQDKLIIGNLNAEIDWGYAPDYVEAMYRILQLPSAGDFVISSGKTHTVRDFVKGVFEYLDLDWTKYVEEDPNLITKKEKHNLRGNNQKLKTMTGWQPTVSFNDLIKIMVKEELKHVGNK
jgi:GDPmannose 4,6-dehydratase